jgi:hypothetical protein
VDKRIKQEKTPAHAIKLGIFRLFFNRKIGVDKNALASDSMGIAWITGVYVIAPFPKPAA